MIALAEAASFIRFWFLFLFHGYWVKRVFSWTIFLGFFFWASMISCALKSAPETLERCYVMSRKRKPKMIIHVPWFWFGIIRTLLDLLCLLHMKCYLLCKNPKQIHIINTFTIHTSVNICLVVKPKKFLKSTMLNFGNIDDTSTTYKSVLTFWVINMYMSDSKVWYYRTIGTYKSKLQAWYDIPSETYQHMHDTCLVLH